MATVLDDTGRVKKGVVGYTGNKRLVIVVDVDRFGLRLVSLPRQAYSSHADDFHGILVKGQEPYRVAPSLWVDPIDISTLNPENRAVIEKLGIAPLGRTELGYVPPAEPVFEPAIVVRPDIDAPAPFDEQPTSKKLSDTSSGGKKPKVTTNTLLSVTGLAPVIPALRREAQFKTLHRILAERARTEGELLEEALKTDVFKGYALNTVHWQVYQLVLNGIFKVGA